MNCADEYFKFLCKWILQNCSEEMKFVSKRIDKSSSYRLESMISSSIEKISYMEALKKVNCISLLFFANILTSKQFYLINIPSDKWRAGCS